MTTLDGRTALTPDVTITIETRTGRLVLTATHPIGNLTVEEDLTTGDYEIRGTGLRRRQEPETDG